MLEHDARTVRNLPASPAPAEHEAEAIERALGASRPVRAGGEAGDGPVAGDGEKARVQVRRMAHAAKAGALFIMLIAMSKLQLPAAHRRAHGHRRDLACGAIATP
jgi:hypothetical protein